LTPSQTLFLVGTGINPLSLEISQGSEFYTFMDMREEHQWKTVNMTSKRWVDAAPTYNARLGLSGNLAKSPRALVAN
ncbi:hypothetical protein C8R44DRAFT_643449, partial [Mycena epipterygia]